MNVAIPAYPVERAAARRTARSMTIRRRPGDAAASTGLDLGRNRYDRVQQSFRDATTA
jgi:hypothetical protein